MQIDADIRSARGPDPSWYASESAWQRTREQVLARTWHLVDDITGLEKPHRVKPSTLLPGSLDEPMLWTTTDDGLHALSNVCTHRAATLCDTPCSARAIRCPYHGRRFALDGSFLSMPEFEGVADFPSPEDDLAAVPSARVGPFLFASAAPAMPFDEVFAPVAALLRGVPLDRLVLDREGSRDYLVESHWALYAENYLEGFHVPFVHRGLATTLDYGAYRTELFEQASVQIGIVGPDEPALELPADHPYAGERIGGLYITLFPTTMINVYPWGISLNLLQPLTTTTTRVCYRFWVAQPELRDVGPGGDLHRVELEDEAIVARVQQGVRSRFARRARYSVRRERGVHHFHRLLADYLAT